MPVPPNPPSFLTKDGGFGGDGTSPPTFLPKLKVQTQYARIGSEKEERAVANELAPLMDDFYSYFLGLYHEQTSASQTAAASGSAGDVPAAKTAAPGLPFIVFESIGTAITPSMFKLDSGDLFEPLVAEQFSLLANTVPVLNGSEISAPGLLTVDGYYGTLLAQAQALPTTNVDAFNAIKHDARETFDNAALEPRVAGHITYRPALPTPPDWPLPSGTAAWVSHTLVRNESSPQAPAAGSAPAALVKPPTPAASAPPPPPRAMPVWGLRIAPPALSQAVTSLTAAHDAVPRRLLIPAEPKHTDIAVVTTPQGALQLFAIDAANGIWTRWQVSGQAGAGWTNWTPFPGKATRIIGGDWPGNRPQLWSIGATDQKLYTCWRVSDQPGAPWTAWSAMPGATSRMIDAAAVKLPQGGLQLFAIDTAHTIWTCVKATNTIAATWQAWTKFPGQALRITSGSLSNGIPQLWAIGSQDQKLSTCWKVSAQPGAAWTPWSPMPGASSRMIDVATVQTPQGELQVFATDVTHTIWTCGKVSSQATAKWSNWVPFPGKATRITSGLLPFTIPQLWMIGAEDQRLYTCRKASAQPGANWTSWEPFDAAATAAATPQAGLHVSLLAPASGGARPAPPAPPVIHAAPPAAVTPASGGPAQASVRPDTLALHVQELSLRANAQPVTSQGLTLSFEYCLVAASRPWMSPFLSWRNWFVQGMRAGDIASGAGTGPGVLEAIPVAAIVVRKLTIDANWSDQDATALNSAVTLGPFSLVGRTIAPASGQAGSTLSCEGMQIVAWVMQPLPKLPPCDDPALAAATIPAASGTAGAAAAALTPAPAPAPGPVPTQAPAPTPAPVSAPVTARAPEPSATPANGAGAAPVATTPAAPPPPLAPAPPVPAAAPVPAIAQP